ncbi:MAG: hypothetical protein DIZ80_03535 [endosymbiont of Galathealinum brachiosum]|uniref:Uncharacterized protein n=1 Tax=endosymbiont of Galathealinum brachiosum TaxID=2200906 RepID=A0A370DI14_9GAMM|nr:MAG: hypothetical protein DIZ80_03535 [endosymbiont of Galathealinum brachiosum]
MSTLVAVVNGDSEIEFDRSKPLAEQQLVYLDKMDEKMDMGIPGGQGNIFAPDQEQKALFVANQLMMAIESNNEQLIFASLAYLANRLPDLKQVTAKDKDGKQQISLIYDREYTPPQEINFVKPENLNS